MFEFPHYPDPVEGELQQQGSIAKLYSPVHIAMLVMNWNTGLALYLYEVGVRSAYTPPYPEPIILNPGYVVLVTYWETNSDQIFASLVY